MTKKIELDIEKEYDKYTNWVEKYAESVYYEKIYPYLCKYSLVFLPGMGGWGIFSTDNTPKEYYKKHKGYYDGTIDPPKRIAAILDSKIAGVPMQDFGSYMPKYKGE